MALKPSLTPVAVKKVRELRKKGKTQNELAKQFGVSQSTIHFLLVGKTYKRVA